MVHNMTHMIPYVVLCHACICDRSDMAHIWLSQSSFWLYHCDMVTVFIAPLLYDDLPWKRNNILNFSIVICF